MISDLIRTVLELYSYALLAWVILSWIQVPATHPLRRIQVFLDRIIYPVILPLRRIIPPIRFGSGAIDLSPIIVFIGIRLLIGIL